MTEGSQLSTAPRAHAMTCDVEDYFQVSAFEHLAPRDRWSSFECRLAGNIDKVLEMFSEHETRATFFTLGWVAENEPAAVRRIVEEGHELASHGMYHRRVWSQSEDEFRQDASDSKKLLEDVGGVEVTGYRAPSWSIDERTPWAHDVLADIGYRYSSSIYPVAHDHYGTPDAQRNPHTVDGAGIREIPATTQRVLGRNTPVAGGGYFRLYPLFLSRQFIARHESAEDYPFVFYFHPWELDPDQPRMKDINLKTRLRHYLNLRAFESRLESILRSYRWDRMDRLFGENT